MGMKKRALKKQLRAAHMLNADLKCRVKELTEKLIRVNESVSIPDDVSPVQIIEAEQVIYGNYAVIASELLNEKQSSILVRKLAESLAAGMIERNVAQVIRKDNEDNPLCQPTVAVKLYVVPWDQMIPRHIRIEVKDDV